MFDFGRFVVVSHETRKKLETRNKKEAILERATFLTIYFLKVKDLFMTRCLDIFLEQAIFFRNQSFADISESFRVTEAANAQTHNTLGAS